MTSGMLRRHRASGHGADMRGVVVLLLTVAVCRAGQCSNILGSVPQSANLKLCADFDDGTLADRAAMETI